MSIPPPSRDPRNFADLDPEMQRRFEALWAELRRRADEQTAALGAQGAALSTLINARLKADADRTDATTGDLTRHLSSGLTVMSGQRDHSDPATFDNFTGSVTFPAAFTVAPLLLLSVSDLTGTQYSAAPPLYAAYHNLTTTGFDYRITGTGLTDVRLTYRAEGLT